MLAPDASMWGLVSIAVERPVASANIANASKTDLVSLILRSDLAIR
jgi:hypothetical protein